MAQDALKVSSANHVQQSFNCNLVSHVSPTTDPNLGEKLHWLLIVNCEEGPRSFAYQLGIRPLVQGKGVV